MHRVRQVGRCEFDRKLGVEHGEQVGRVLDPVGVDDVDQAAVHGRPTASAAVAAFVGYPHLFLHGNHHLERQVRIAEQCRDAGERREDGEHRAVFRGHPPAHDALAVRSGLDDVAVPSDGVDQRHAVFFE